MIQNFQWKVPPGQEYTYPLWHQIPAPRQVEDGLPISEQWEITNRRTAAGFLRDCRIGLRTPVQKTKTYQINNTTVRVWRTKIAFLVTDIHVPMRSKNANHEND